MKHVIRRQSRHRRVILEELRKVVSHPTAEELYDVVRSRLHGISLGTVYRNLEVLVEKGRIRKLRSGAFPARFDADRDEHLHVNCVRCGRVADIHATLPEPSLDDLEIPAGFEILGLRQDLVGLCPGCRRDPATEVEEETR